MNQSDELNFSGISKKDRIRVLDVQEKERQRIARDLHDYALQNLTHLIHQLDLCSMEMDDDPVRAKLEIMSVKKNLKSIIADIRNTIFDLRPMPFDDLGSREVFQRLEENLRANSDMEICFDIENIDSLDSILQMTLFRLIQEGSLNSVKHAKGTRLDVVLRQKRKKIFVTIRDDGIGFDLTGDGEDLESHFGLKIMKERIELLSGEMTVVSGSGGTQIDLIVPVKP